MTYDPSLPEPLDRIRLIVGDTANQPGAEGYPNVPEMFPDETYEAEIARYANWKLAAAAMAEAAAVKIEQDPTTITFPGDMSVAWNVRTVSLRQKAAQLRAEAAAEETTSATTAVPYMPVLKPVDWR